jgi:hypothetical protein
MVLMDILGLKEKDFASISSEISYLWMRIKNSNPMKMNRIKEALQETGERINTGMAGRTTWKKF